MIRLDMEQGSPEWIAARIGLPTSSQFHRILTPKTGKLSSGSHSYMCELLAEWMLKSSLDSTLTDFMQRGTDLEDQAVKFYELQRETDTDKVGMLMLTDDNNAPITACSPDRLVGEDGGLEIKCPSAAVHVANLLEMTEKFNAQVQGALWISGREWWDLLSYHPELPPALNRFYRDDEFIGKLEMALGEFITRLHSSREHLISLGYAEAA